MRGEGTNLQNTVCGEISKSRRALSHHVWYFHTNRKRPSCDTCHRVFGTLADLRRHIKAVHSTAERPRFPCTFLECEKIYQTRSGLQQHFKTEHAENPVRFPCTLCRKEFKTRDQLQGHIFTHTTEKMYTCATCGKSLAYRTNIESHEKTHLEKSVREVSKCHICPQTFLSRGALQRHIRAVHENQRNYPCELCDKRFSNASTLRVHVEARHPTNKELIHSCDKCEYKSHSKANFTAHRKRHNAAKHECYFCQKKFFNFCELVRHCGTVHTLEK
ncbi:oocyte zinc finger protein XlCOF15 isoform X2 [Folsomia candida]|uniref:oocyte zinc finger protein XlCOF15 isoform X2 n=1 Tax=Folsomia candida TaxID=158441 RepID=UPI000B9068EE|nr:oocyte zinc finger protein XlCOF15 isoform X2 [Folsomia candida]